MWTILPRDFHPWQGEAGRFLDLGLRCLFVQLGDLQHHSQDYSARMDSTGGVYGIHFARFSHGELESLAQIRLASLGAVAV